MAEGQRLQKIIRTAKDPVRLRRAIVVLMSAQRSAGYIGYCRSSPGSPASALAVARCFSSANGSPVTTYTCQRWRFALDGARVAATSTRSSTSLGTGSLLNARTARRLSTASYTSNVCSSFHSTARSPCPDLGGHQGADRR